MALRDYWELTKPRLSLLSVITALVGYMAADSQRDGSVFLSLLIGTSLAAGAAGALNQWLEREVDRHMARTRDRPLPSEAISPQAALTFGLALGIAGVTLVWLGANPLAGALTLATLVSYLLVYTPLKRVTAWNTLIGAVPGALPPLIGWAAAQGQIAPLGWILFGILFCWQIPHFMAIAWLYREDYAQGGFVMSTVTDPSGQAAARQSLAHSLILLGISLLPSLLGYTSWLLYGLVALICGLGYFWTAFRFWRVGGEQRTPASRKLFLASIAYLPFLLGALVIDRWLIG
ncbi:protoheme IX farnesyltransferase [Cerasicoccus arenae]|uniref:Protoheme IX farnesyltransferase n=2 Tax=Cerasicoccus arenae TaxID=424488 RepID=A0A8J3GC36_9BACT|nr:protoheme IX farnesyltransferase [Cerasicoccus arenae]